MPPLTDARREAFAQAFVRCGNQAAAFREAGYKYHSGGACRLAARPPVAARIAELEGRREAICRAGPEETIADLMAMAEIADHLKSAAGLREARLARLDANRLWRETQAAAWVDYGPPLPPELTEEEWVAKYGVPAPGEGV